MLTIIFNVPVLIGLFIVALFFFVASKRKAIVNGSKTTGTEVHRFKWFICRN